MNVWKYMAHNQQALCTGQIVSIVNTKKYLAMMTKEDIFNKSEVFFCIFEGYYSLCTAHILLDIPDDILGFNEQLKLINQANPDLDIDFLTKLIDTFDEIINMNSFKSFKDFNSNKERYDYYFKETRKAFGYDVV